MDVDEVVEQEGHYQKVVAAQPFIDTVIPQLIESLLDALCNETNEQARGIILGRIWALRELRKAHQFYRALHEQRIVERRIIGEAI